VPNLLGGESGAVEGVLTTIAATIAEVVGILGVTIAADLPEVERRTLLTGALRQASPENRLKAISLLVERLR
jgi:hypothetical protein